MNLIRQTRCLIHSRMIYLFEMVTAWLAYNLCNVMCLNNNMITSRNARLQISLSHYFKYANLTQYFSPPDSSKA